MSWVSALETGCNNIMSVLVDKILLCPELTHCRCLRIGGGSLDGILKVALGVLYGESAEKATGVVVDGVGQCNNITVDVHLCV